MSDEWVVTMPKLGETVTEGEITNWFKVAGDEVAFDDPLFEVSTDKVDSEIPSPYDGVLLEILVASGETVPVGTPLVRIGPPGSTPGPQAKHAGVDVPAAATRATAAAGGPSLGDAAAPQTGGSEGPASDAPGAVTGDVHDITMPKLGETVTEGTIGSWLKQAGDTVAFDDPLFEVSTDKVDSEIPSPYDGVLLEILVPAGETVPVGTPLARIGEPGAIGDAATVTGTAAAATSGTPSSAASGGSVTNGAPPRADAGRMLSPLVRRLVEEAGLDVAAIIGTGAGGRIRREDVEQAVAAGAGQTAPAQPATSAQPAPPVQQAPPARPTAAARPATAPAPKLGERDEAQPLSRMRLAIAERMLHSVQTAPAVWTSVEVDLDAIERVRAKHKERFRKEEGMSLTQLAFVARAVCDALRAFPNVNSSLDMESKSRILHHYVNLAIAVDLNEQGLVAPVIRDADALNLRGLARAIRATAQKATSGKFGADDLAGSTFTLTSPGPIADYASAPIINQPNSAIMSLNIITRRPVAVGDAITIHPVTVLGFTYDHRAFDGVTASRFMAHVRDSLQDRDWEAEIG